MEANKAPEKLYVDTKDRLGDSILYGFTEKRKDDDIEYIRKDTFIEKVEKFLKSYRRETPDKTGYISGVVDDKMIEDFETYIKG